MTTKKPLKTADEDRETVESLALELKTPDWLFAATKAYNRWPIGHLTTRSEYEAALKAVGGLTFANP